jgi:hypothetical protein
MEKTELLRVEWSTGDEVQWVSPLFKTREDLDKWMAEFRAGDSYEEEDIRGYSLITY